VHVEAGARLANERSLERIANPRRDERRGDGAGECDVEIGWNHAGEKSHEHGNRCRAAVAVGEYDRPAAGAAPGKKQAALYRIVDGVDAVERRRYGQRSYGAGDVDRQARADRNAGACAVHLNARRLRAAGACAC